MITKTITGNEETISLESNDDIQIDGVFSFQNISSYQVRWSTEVFSGNNHGSSLNPMQERVLGSATTIYFKKMDTVASVQCRAVAL